MLQPEAAPNEPTLLGSPPRMLGKYRLLRPLGAGGMGVVFEAEDTVLHRKVAVKLLQGKHEGPGGPIERFLREGRAAARLSHPNVVPIFDVGQVQNTAFLVMEYLPGGSVHQLVQSLGRVPWQRAVTLVIHAGRGLAAAHAAGLVHRDVKLGNLLLAADGTVKVADFGLVKVIDDSSLGVASISGPSRLLGTPHFMSPEQCRSETLDERTDVYSLAVCLYVLLTGRLPFDSENVYGILYAHCSATPPDAKTLAPDLPAALLEVLKCGMARARGSRYATMNAFVAALDRVLGAAVTLEKPENTLYPPPPPLPQPPRRLSRRVALVGLLAAGVASAVTGTWWLFQSGKEVPHELPPVDADAVLAKLKAANPTWKGEFVVKREKEHVVGLDLTGDELTDLEPLIELRDLMSLSYVGSGWDDGKHRSKLKNVAPVGQLTMLRRLTLQRAPVSNLRPLGGRRLIECDLEGCQLYTLDALAGMPLRKLNVSSTNIESFAPLANSPYLEDVHVGTWGITHLEDLSGLPLKRLSLSGSRVSDLRPIRKCPLVYLECIFTEVRSLADLEGMPIEHLRCKKELLPTLPRLPNLKRVNDDPWPPR